MSASPQLYCVIELLLEVEQARASPPLVHMLHNHYNQYDSPYIAVGLNKMKMTHKRFVVVSVFTARHISLNLQYDLFWRFMLNQPLPDIV